MTHHNTHTYIYESYDTSQNQQAVELGSFTFPYIPAYIPVYISHISCIPRLAKDPDAKGHFSKKFDSPFGDCVSTRVHSAPLTLFFCFAVQGPSTNVEHWFWTSARLNLWSLKMSQDVSSAAEHRWRSPLGSPVSPQAYSARDRPGNDQLRSATILRLAFYAFVLFQLFRSGSFRSSFRRFFFFVNHFDFSGFSMFLHVSPCKEMLSRHRRWSAMLRLGQNPGWPDLKWRCHIRNGLGAVHWTYKTG